MAKKESFQEYVTRHKMKSQGLNRKSKRKN